MTNPTQSEIEAITYELGHEFQYITGQTQECRLCGCMVNDCQNWEGKDGSRFYSQCTRARATGFDIGD